MDGTSQAAPCVTGVVCLMLQKKPYLTPAQICEALETSATKLSETKSNETGSGCVNALLALEEIEDYENLNGNDPDSIEELTSAVNIYPNPVNDILYIETQTLTMTQTMTLTVEIYDAFGRQWSTVNGQQSLSIDVSNLNSGVYFVKINTANGNIVNKFIKK